jgi:hypothetical protein
MVDVTIVETRTVPIPEPVWCVDPHEGAHRFSDLTHNGPATTASIDGVRYLTAHLSHAPYLDNQSEPHPVVAVVLDLEADFGADEIPALTRSLRQAADHLDQLAAHALRLRGGAQ